MGKKRTIIGFIIISICIIAIAVIGINYTEKQEVMKQQEEQRQQKKKEVLVEADKLKQGYYVDEAINLLKSDENIVDEEVNNKIEEYDKYKKSLVKYEGKVEHIFFHSLIVYPELAFDKKGHPAEGYNMWFTTVKEFKTMLPMLRDNGYVLVKITDLYKKDEMGKMVQQDIYLPQGKKPLVLSQDDANYYDYMKPDGFADRLVIDENNEISTLVRDLNGQAKVTRDGDIVPILDDFIKENPEFSYKGAKGILAVTGYEGVLGYRFDSEKNKQEASKVAKTLKENGWLIASHSYTHNGTGYFGDKPDYNNIKSDFERWDTRVKPIVGDTNVYISPFGVLLEGKNYELAEEYGFDIYCNVERKIYSRIKGNTVIMPRFNLDGYTFTYEKDIIKERFFDPDKVIDSARPPLKASR